MSALSERAERLSLRRARTLPILGIVLITQQASFVTTVADGMPLRTVDAVQVAVWVAMVLMLLAALVTGGIWPRSRELRALVDDEVTRANRARALSVGFVVSIVTGIVCYVVAMVRTTDPRIAAHVIVSTGIAAALMRFGALERRALRG